MKKIILFLILFGTYDVFAKPSRLKDLVQVKGVRENPIIGYGLVIGLNGTGDGGGEIIDNSLRRMFQKLGLNPQREISSKNVASVVVTSKLPPFARIGQKIDIIVSSIGNAGSLAGGTLLVTPLKGGDGKVYSVASGPVSIGGLDNGSRFPTTATIPNGATVEREIELNFDKKNSLRLSLNNPDFTTAARIAKIINQELGGQYSNSRDATTVDLVIPVHYQRKVVELMAIIENFKVYTDQRAKIVINERTGTVVAGGEVVLKPVSITHRELTIEVKGEEEGGEADLPNRTIYMEEKATLNDLVKSLNAFGATPQDLISIFQTLKKNGALIADIELI